MTHEKSNKDNLSVIDKYVCPQCFHRVHECVCEIFPPEYLVEIDKEMREVLRILNDKGYMTSYSCEGHGLNGQTYVKFADRLYFPGMDIMSPKGFKFERSSNVMKHCYSENCEDFQKEKQEMLHNLLLWCNTLPINKKVSDFRNASSLPKSFQKVGFNR